MGYISDLEETEWWHVIDYAYSKSIPEKFNAIMVGWLGSKVPHEGKIETQTIKKLEWARDNRTIDQAWLGEHECEICNNYIDRGEILIIDGEKMYVAPRMILHYIKEHSYRPPEEFLEAVDKINVT
ncbi:hypothetical protein ACFL6B_04775 [Thermodesulfobacteriota bacterium]